MRFQTYQRVRRSARTALLVVPIAALGALLLPANAAQQHKIKEPGLIKTTWSASTSGVTARPYRTVWSSSAQGRNMPSSYHGAVVIQRLGGTGWVSGMELTPAAARELAVNLTKSLHGTSGSIQIWNHDHGTLNATDMHFRAQPAFGLAWSLIMSAAGH